MATAWVRSLSCRSYGVADAVVAPSPSKKLQSPPIAMPMLPVVSCAAAEDVRDSVAFMRHSAKKPRREERPRREPRPPKKKPKQVLAAAAFMPSPAPSAAPVSSAFLTMAELPEGHSSWRVVELIFSSGWGAASSAAPEPTVEAMFRVHSAARAVARFEETRAAARAHGAAARCGADGNEMMRFQCCAAAGSGGVFGAGVATCHLGPTDTAVRTFSGSGAAHASAGAGPGRRAMLVCRVIAGRVRPVQNDHSRHASDYDSVDMGNGELVVLDSRAVLPCFLIIYKV